MRRQGTIRARAADRPVDLNRLRLASAVLSIAGLLLLGVAAAPAGAARGLDTGIDDAILKSSDQSFRDTWFDRAVEGKPKLIRFNNLWGVVAPTEPAEPRNPADPAYNFTTLDGAVRDAAERGMSPLITTYFAPAWAEGANRPSTDKARPGTWKPNPSKFAKFGEALAKRYSGTFPDPQGGTLPRVRYFEAWNEANLDNFFTPQRKGKKLKSPTHYRKLVNAFSDAVKSVKSTNKVVGPSTGPFGDPSGPRRIEPVEFQRELFCLRGELDNLRSKSNCKTSKLPKLDVVSHHPIGAFGGGPRNTATGTGDVTSADMDRIVKIARAAAKAGNILPRKSAKKSAQRDVWVTEFFYFSRPPLNSQFAVSTAKHARWLEESMYIFWKDGVDAAIWLGLADSPDNGLSNPSPFSAGLFFLDGDAKPALTAFRFPFVTERSSKSKIMVWGKAPLSGKLQVQEKGSGGWKTIKRINVKEGKVFYKKAPLKGAAKLRGLLDGETSRTWTQKG